MTIHIILKSCKIFFKIVQVFEGNKYHIWYVVIDELYRDYLLAEVWYKVEIFIFGLVVWVFAKDLIVFVLDER